MNQRLVFVIICACAVAIAVPAVARAACTVRVSGIDYLDTDCDGVRDADDNCVNAANGYDCDTDEENCDVDGDGLASDAELAAGDQADWDADHVGDACDMSDADTFVDYLDNCPGVTNEDQDAIACVDTDGDGVMDPDDNCTGQINPSQNDTDLDTIGDACDVCPFTANPDQDPNACPASQRGPIADPEAVTPVTRPQPGVSVGALPEHVEGSGGCSLAASAVPTPWAALVLAAAGAVAAIRRMRRG